MSQVLKELLVELRVNNMGGVGGRDTAGRPCCWLCQTMGSLEGFLLAVPLCLPIPTCLWVSHLTFLGLGFLMGKMVVILITLLQVFCE